MSSNEQVSVEQESHFSSPLRRSRVQKQSSPSLLLVVTCFVAFWALLATPVVQVRIAPLFDFPNHLARMYLISEVDNNPLLYRFYSIHWAMIPNLAMDVIVPPIAKVIGLFQAGRLFMLLLIALLLSGVHAIHFGVTRRWSPSPLVAAIIMYNQALVYGLVNYLFGVGVVLWGLAVWISMRDKPPILRATISLIFVVATFFSHLAAAGLYALSVLAVEICANSGVRRDDRRPTSVDIAVFILPIAAIPLLMAFGPTIEHVDAVGWVGDACTSIPLRCYLSQKAKAFGGCSRLTRA